MYKLSGEITRDLASEYCEMVQSGDSREYAQDHIKQTVINNYDGEVWEIVDSEDNSDELDFYEVVNEVVDEVVMLGEDYLENEGNV
jgi:hypothetical protein